MPVQSGFSALFCRSNRNRRLSGLFFRSGPRLSAGEWGKSNQNADECHGDTQPILKPNIIASTASGLLEDH
jgi:hypothetical protein